MASQLWLTILTGIINNKLLPLFIITNILVSPNIKQGCCSLFVVSIAPNLETSNKTTQFFHKFMTLAFVGKLNILLVKFYLDVFNLVFYQSNNFGDKALPIPVKSRILCQFISPKHINESS